VRVGGVAGSGARRGGEGGGDCCAALGGEGGGGVGECGVAMVRVVVCGRRTRCRVGRVGCAVLRCAGGASGVGWGGMDGSMSSTRRAWVVGDMDY